MALPWPTPELHRVVVPVVGLNCIDRSTALKSHSVSWKSDGSRCGGDGWQWLRWRRGAAVGAIAIVVGRGQPVIDASAGRAVMARLAADPNFTQSAHRSNAAG
jgi:hypothetical protein